jgi:hypothetical protein
MAEIADRADPATTAPYPATPAPATRPMIDRPAMNPRAPGQVFTRRTMRSVSSVSTIHSTE